MIGGIDIVLHGKPQRDDIDRIIRAARAVWPDGMVEPGDEDFVCTYEEAIRRKWVIPCDFYIYKTTSAYQSWAQDGRTDDNAAYLVTVVIQSDAISFIIDSDEVASNEVVNCAITMRDLNDNCAISNHQIQ